MSLVTSLPASHGVVRLSNDDATVSVVASADVRGLALDRLGPEASVGNDLRGACDRVCCWSAGSSFEADLRFLDVAAEHAPDLARQAAGRLAVWWLRVDHDRPGDGWSITDAPEPIGDVSVVGPFLDRSSAKRWAEMLDDLFELCRYPGEVRKAPGGTACAYHEMGRCPAACNGSEPMEAYLARLREAVSLNAAGVAERSEVLKAAMQRASAEGAFERAAALRDRIDALPDADDRAAKVVGPIEALEAIAVVPPRRGTRVQLLRVGRSAWASLGVVDVADDDARSTIESFIAAELQRGDTPAAGGVLAREMIRPRRGGPVLVPVREASAKRIWIEARRAAKIDPETDAPAEQGADDA